MRTPLSWIRDFTPLDAPPVEIAEALAQLGIEVEAIEEPGAEIRGVIAAKILDVVPHPDADKIRLADVDFGDGQLRVVCGAPNIEPGMVVPFARVGAVLPGDFQITKRKIRGVVSEGMLCSSRELGLGDDHSGILALPGDAELGRDVREILGLDDTIFDLSVTPNRPDAMGIVGVARELAAHFRLDFDAPAPQPQPVVDTIGDVTVTVEVPVRCPRFVGRVARVQMGPSPEWMQRRLTLAGMRPISNVVDVTNYVLLERCRPLHAFDLTRLAGRGIVVRLARDGEQMTTLDGVVRTLAADDLLICDATRAPQAIAGIMGGRDSEVDDSTTEVLIESAHFEPSGIAKSSKRLGLRSEASARFERGIDPNGAVAGADLAIQLLTEIAGAEAEPGMIDVNPHPVERPRIVVRTTKVNAILGTALPATEVRALLEPLGIETETLGNPGEFVAVTPTWRPDLEREIDIVEEVARRHGYQHIVHTVARPPAGVVGGLTPRQRDRRLVIDTLVGFGADEAMTMPLLSSADLDRAKVKIQGALVQLVNPLRVEESVLRPTLRPGLLAALARNAAHGLRDVALCELGTVFFAPRPGDTLPDERDHLALVMVGTRSGAPRRADRPVDVGDALDALYALADALGIVDVRLEPAVVPGFHPGRGARIVVDGDRAVGSIGELDPQVVEAYDLTGAVVGFELDAGAFLDAARSDRLTRQISQYPPASFDLAFVVAETVGAAAVESTLRSAAGELLESVRLFDVYRGEHVGEGRTSLAFALRVRAQDRTLADTDVAVVRQSCIDAVTTAHGAQLRS